MEENRSLRIVKDAKFLYFKKRCFDLSTHGLPGHLVKITSSSPGNYTSGTHISMKSPLHYQDPGTHEAGTSVRRRKDGRLFVPSIPAVSLQHPQFNIFI